METRNELLMNETQYRLLMCCRMAKALSVGEVYLDATTHKMCWVLEKDGRPDSRFRSIDELEAHLEHLLVHRSRISCNGLGNMSREVKRRCNVVRERANGVQPLLSSRINKNKIWKTERNAITAER